MKIDTQALQTTNVIPRKIISVDEAKKMYPPKVEEPVHYKEPSWTGYSVRLCDLSDQQGNMTKDYDKVTCKTCRKRGAWLYGW